MRPWDEKLGAVHKKLQQSHLLGGAMDPQRTNELLEMITSSPSKAHTRAGKVFAAPHKLAVNKSIATKKSSGSVTKSKSATKQLAAENNSAVKMAQGEGIARSLGRAGQHVTKEKTAGRGTAREDAKLLAQQTDAVGLPAGWAWMWDEETVQSYYVDHNTRTTHWDRPKVGTGQSSLVGEAALQGTEAGGGTTEKKDKNKKTKEKQNAKMQHKTNNQGHGSAPLVVKGNSTAVLDHENLQNKIQTLSREKHASIQAEDYRKVSSSNRATMCDMGSKLHPSPCT